MRFSLSVALLSAAIATFSTLAVFVPFQPSGDLGSQWSTLPIPSQVSYKPTVDDQKDPSACSLNITIVTSKCAGGPHRWGSIFQAYDKYSQKSYTVKSMNKASDGDLYSKYKFVAQCGTNGRIFPTDEVENMEKIFYQGVRFFNTKTFSAAWVEKTPTDDETGENREVIAHLRKYYFSDTPTKLKNLVNYEGATFGWDNSRLVTRTKNAELYIEYCS